MASEVRTDYAKPGQARIFKSNFLESLTKSNPFLNIIIYGFTIIALIYVALFVKNISFLGFLVTFTTALFFWTFMEYILHRYLFHFVNEKPAVQRFHFIMHGAHHEFPKDEERLLMPPVPGLLMASILFGIYYVVFYLFGYADLTWAFFPGFFLGYLMYSFVHRATHIYKPPKPLQYLWTHHSLHHYKYPNKCFGVSNTIWDHVFGTMPPKDNNINS